MAMPSQAVDTNVTWESMDHNVRTIMRAMSADERETVSFRIVKARLLEIGLTNDQVACHKGAIKDLAVQLIGMGDEEESVTPVGFQAQKASHLLS